MGSTTKTPSTEEEQNAPLLRKASSTYPSKESSSSLTESDSTMGVSSSTKPQDQKSGTSTGTGMSPATLKLRLLGLLVIQGSSGILTGRYTRASVSEDELYEISHLVFVIECVKLVLSVIAEYMQTNGKVVESVQEHILQNPIDSLKVLVPAVLYVIQNSLVYIALSNLEAPVFISLQQGKLIATALVSVAMLNRSYSTKQWLCLFVLAVGVATVALDERGQQLDLELESADELISTALAVEEFEKISMEETEELPQRFLVGILAVTGSCFSSAFAGVYFEKVLAPEKTNIGKASNKKVVEGDVEAAPPNVTAAPSAKSLPSLWIRNMQLAFFSIIFAYLQGLYEKRAAVEESLLRDMDTELLDHKPYLHGFTKYVWLLVGIQACGGLLVAAVMKYADNVLKGLAMGVGVVVASVLSTILFDVQLSKQFVLGGTIIFAAVYCFSNDVPCSKALTKAPPPPETEMSQETTTE